MTADVIAPAWMHEQITAEQYDSWPEEQCAGIEVVDGMVVASPSASKRHTRLARIPLPGEDRPRLRLSDVSGVQAGEQRFDQRVHGLAGAVAEVGADASEHVDAGAVAESGPQVQRS